MAAPAFAALAAEALKQLRNHKDATYVASCAGVGAGFCAAAPHAVLAFLRANGSRGRSGRLVAELFVKLPSAKEYPDYYEVINDPIDLKTIKVCCRLPREAAAGSADLRPLAASLGGSWL